MYVWWYMRVPMTIIIILLYNGTHHAKNIIAVHTSATPIMEEVSCSRFEHLFKVGISHHGSPKYTKIDQLAARALRFTSLNKITIKNCPAVTTLEKLSAALGALPALSTQAGWTPFPLLHAGTVLHLGGRNCNDGLPLGRTRECHGGSTHSNW